MQWTGNGLVVVASACTARTDYGLVCGTGNLRSSVNRRRLSGPASTITAIVPNLWSTKPRISVRTVPRRTSSLPHNLSHVYPRRRCGRATYGLGWGTEQSAILGFRPM